MNPNQNTPNPEMPATEPPIIPPQQNEIPVQKEQQPIVVEPVVQQPIETVVVQPPAQNVVPDMQTPQPIQAQQEVVQPAATISSTTETAFGAQPQAVVGSPLILNPVPVKKSKLKLLITIAVAIVVLAGTAVSAWFLAPSLFNVGPPLKEYSAKSFTISLPESYVIDPKSSSEDSAIYFTKKVGDANDDDSKVFVMAGGGEFTGSRIDQEKRFDDEFTESKKDDIINRLGWNGMSEAKFSSSGVSINKYKMNGMSVYEISGKYSVLDSSGSFSCANYINDTKGAQIYISAGKADIDISADAKRIIESFKFK